MTTTKTGAAGQGSKRSSRSTSSTCPPCRCETARAVDQSRMDEVRRPRGGRGPLREPDRDLHRRIGGTAADGNEGAVVIRPTSAPRLRAGCRMSLANNAREMLDQSKLALRHIELGTYGSCDNCGKPVGGTPAGFPRATLCVACKQRGADTVSPA